MTLKMETMHISNDVFHLFNIKVDNVFINKFIKKHKPAKNVMLVSVPMVVVFLTKILRVGNSILKLCDLDR